MRAARETADPEDRLRPVFRDGEVLISHTVAEVRERANQFSGCDGICRATSGIVAGQEACCAALVSSSSEAKNFPIIILAVA